MCAPNTNSRDTRVQPVFQWLIENAGDAWPQKLLNLANGMVDIEQCGVVCEVCLNPERQVEASPTRLAWMLRNVSHLVPVDGRQWRMPRERTRDVDQVNAALARLDAGDGTNLPPPLRFEGSTHADCLIECERMFIWIEGKRFDWVSPSTTWDVSRDQLARNLEAVWSVATEKKKDYCLLICHEHPLKHHEQALVNGYRTRTWTAGWPHLTEPQRADFSRRIGTVTWQAIAEKWPQLHAHLQGLGEPAA